MAKKKNEVAKRTDLEKKVFDYTVPKWDFDKEGQMHPACTEEENKAWAKSMAALFGTKDKDNMTASLLSLMAVVGHKEDSAINGVMATMKAINPADELEAMLAVQMVGTHFLSMKMMGRAIHNDNPDIVRDQINRVTKLSRTFIAQMEALNKHRGKGQQKMTVEHVHVNEGGQAIVGNVVRGGDGKKN